MKTTKLLFSLLLIITFGKTSAQSIKDSINLKYIDEKDLKSYVKFLASKELEGRMTGEKGQKLAADYIEKVYEEHGLLPWTRDSYRQNFSPQYYKYGQICLRTDKTIINNLEEIFYSSHTKEIIETEKDLVFIGKPDTIALKSIDLSDKVIALTLDNIHLVHKYTTFFGNKGVFALLAANPENENQFIGIKKRMGFFKYGEQRLFLGAEFNSKKDLELKKQFEKYNIKNVKLFYLSANALSKILDISKSKLLKKNQNLLQNEFVHAKITLKCDIKVEHVDTENIIGIIKGAEFPEKYLVVTAHYDHIGIKRGKIHPGADDNASGVAGILEIIECLRKNNIQPKYSIAFMATSGEEAGLLGSRYFIKNYPESEMEIIANINLDMIGRTDVKHKKNQKYIYTVGLSKSKELLPYFEKALAKSSVFYDKSLEEKGRLQGSSDHAPFLEEGIPSIFFFSGLHIDYHQPGDTSNKINYALLKERIDLIFYTLWNISNNFVNDNKKS